MNGENLNPGATSKLELSYSAIEDWTRCPSYYLYRRVFNICGTGESMGAASFGQAFHLADEVRAKGSSIEQAIDVALASFNPDPTDEVRTPIKLRILLEEYFKYYAFDVQRYEWLGSEIWFEIPLTDDISFRGYIDKVLRERSTGSIWFKDIKTTSTPASFVAEPNAQFEGYLAADEVVKPVLYLENDLKGLIVDVVAVQKGKPDFRKDSKGFYAGKGPADCFFRYPTYRTPEQLKEWNLQIRMIAYMIHSCYQLETWPMFTSNCRKYNRECAYRGICNRPPQERGSIINSSLFKQREQRPQKGEPIPTAP